MAALDNNYKNKMVRRRGHNKNKASKETKRDNTVAGYSWRSKMNLITLITVLGLCIFYSSGKDSFHSHFMMVTPLPSYLSYSQYFRLEEISSTWLEALVSQL